MPCLGLQVANAPPGADLGQRAVGAGGGAASIVGGAKVLPAMLVAGGILTLE